MEGEWRKMKKDSKKMCEKLCEGDVVFIDGMQEQ